jgi:2-polyprenyl-3-methyl-5-hydroxy-6-metoxy-1,4-benzoquinol methylase
MGKSFYTEGKYLDKNPTWHAADSSWKAQQILKLMHRNRLNPKTICEVGCGAGEVLRHVHEALGKGIVSDGYEISPQAFELCRKLSKDNLRFHCEDLLRNQNLRFDLILVIDVVEHIENCFDFLRALRKKGQFFIFHFPLDMSAQMIVRGTPIMKLRNTVGHVHYFMKDTVLALLKDTGYEVADFFYTPTDLALRAQSIKAWLARVPRRILYSISPDLAVRLVGGFSVLVLAHEA